jgi:transcriptional regulator with XRE-family HTH domain
MAEVSMKNESEYNIENIAWYSRHPEVQGLDNMLKHFTCNDKEAENTLWVKALREGLRITAAGMAEKLNVGRQIISKYEANESAGTISIKTLSAIAEAFDCKLVYGFVPKNHNSFAEMVTEKTLPFVLKPKLRDGLKRLQQERALASRVKSFLSQPTGRGKIWGLKKASGRPYSWNWADFKLSYHPHGIRE